MRQLINMQRTKTPRTVEMRQARTQRITEGEGVLLTRPSGFRKLEAPYPTRKRADHNPLNRKEYMLHILHAY